MAAGVTRDEVKAAFEVVAAVAEAIKALGEVPAGHLYAQLMGHMSHSQFESVIATLVRTGLVRRSNHLLTWVEPSLEPGARAGQTR